MKLGLGPSPEKITYIFIGEADDGDGKTPWYEFDFDSNNKIPIKEDSLTGFLSNIVITKKDFKGVGNYKMNIHITADQKFVIRAGAGTTFSRGFLLSLKKYLENHQLNRDPMTISVKMGEDNNKVVFCGLFHHTEKIFPDWDGEVQLMPIIKEMQVRLGVVVQTKEMIDDPEKYKEALDKLREDEKKSQGPVKPKRKVAKK